MQLTDLYSLNATNKKEPGTATALVSIVVATHNGERFLKEQLDSLVQQTYPHIEIIVVDDASSDDTVSILKTYQSRYPHMRFYFNSETIGHVRNFEKGMQLAAGEYIALCDHDDIWMPAKIERLISIIGDSDLAYCDSELIDDAGKSMKRKLSDIKNLRGYNSCLPYSIGNSVSGHSCLFHRRLLQRALPLNESVIHDWWLAFIGALRTEIKYTDEVLVLYRQHDKNLIGAVNQKGRKRRRDPNYEEVRHIRSRIIAFYERCPESNKEEKEVLKKMAECYRSFSLINNYRRMMLFMKHREHLLAIKKKSEFRKWLFCLKMFFKII